MGALGTRSDAFATNRSNIPATILHFQASRVILETSGIFHRVCTLIELDWSGLSVGLSHSALKGEFLVINSEREKIPQDPQIPCGTRGERSIGQLCVFIF